MYDSSALDHEVSFKENKNKLDKYYSQSRVVRYSPESKKNHVYKVDKYGSKGIGTFIRNAVNGAKTNVLVGSHLENLYFKVVDATGLKGRKEPLMLYYESPEQYEKCLLVSLSPVTKARWFEKYQLCRQMYAKELEDYSL